MCAPTPTRASDRASEGAVVVFAHGAGNDIGVGAGTIVAISGSRIRVITAQHVAVYGPLSLQFDGEATTVPAHILSVIPGHDLAVIEADVDPSFAATLHAATIGRPHRDQPVHIWGSGYGGPALEAGAVAAMGPDLPDGPARGRFGVACNTCHEGDSGGGIFDASGNLVGVYVGYWTLDSGKLGVAEPPTDATRVALETPYTTTVAEAAPAAGNANTAP